MKKFIIFVAGLILVSIAITTIIPFITLAIGATITYHSFKSLMKSPSLLGVIWWGIVGLFGLSICMSSLPSLIGILAIILLYYGYKEMKKEAITKSSTSTYEYDDFTNFEKEWESVMNHHK